MKKDPLLCKIVPSAAPSSCPHTPSNAVVKWRVERLHTHTHTLMRNIVLPCLCVHGTASCTLRAFTDECFFGSLLPTSTKLLAASTKIQDQVKVLQRANQRFSVEFLKSVRLERGRRAATNEG